MSRPFLTSYRPEDMSTSPPANPQAQILVIDDEPDLRTLYELTLLREGYRVEAAGDLAQAREQLQEKRFDAIITDMRLPDGLGLELLREIVAQQRSERCVVITAHGSAENAVEALKAGAFDYLTKPVDLKQFRSVVASAIQGTRVMPPVAAAMRAEADRPPIGVTGLAKSPDANAILQKLVGESQVMRGVKSRIVKVAGSMAPILIQGESGTGKELVARAVHACSHRASGPFVAVNCSAIPENLLEAEFFGARKGAYTGSAQDRQGYFQAAKGGTLFLDEIGDLPLAMQSKLLRAIQERMVRPLGSPQEDAVDVRIVSATHKDLNAEVMAGTFRQDLYYRLNVIEIAVPALRDRRDDLPALCHALLSRICHESGFSMPTLSSAALERLRAHPFNGNVRELENLLHRAVALGDGGELHFEAPPDELVTVPDNLQDFLDQQERNILSKVLEETGFNRTAAATRLGLSLRQIRYRIARLNIATPVSDDAPNDMD
jgi:two-component system, NtrC family, response regulator PilR